jgi:hypothetical protein
MICNKIVHIHPCSTHKFPSPSRTLHRKLLGPFSKLILSHHYLRSRRRWIIVLRGLISLVRIILINNPLSRLELITNSLLLRLQPIYLIFFFIHQVYFPVMPRSLIFFRWPLPCYAPVLHDSLLIKYLQSSIL